MNKSVYIDTLGCAKNEYDSQVLAKYLTSEGCLITDDPTDSDILIINTCGFIEAAKIESINRIMEMVNIKGEKKRLIITGCLSERYHDELIKEIPEVDLIAGVNEYDKLSEIIKSIDLGSNDKFDNKDIVGGEAANTLEYTKRELPLGTYSAVLKVAEGCDNTCAFCAIPSIRGRYRSKKIEDVVREAEDLSLKGVKELILIAQDLSVYGKDIYGKIELAKLLKELCKVDGIRWIRLMYMYDNNITEELIKTIKEEPKICNYIDIPIQHISDNVLNSMRRKSSASSIKSTINMIRSIIPEMCIRTTLMVGFPGETEEDFNELLEFIREYKLDRIGVFSYSDEDGTIAYNMDGKLDEETKKNRVDILMTNQLEISLQKNIEKIGKTFEVIIDEVDGGSIASSLESGVPDFTYIGRTRFDAPEVDCEVTIKSSKEHNTGEIIPVIIEEALEYDLIGSEVEEL